jgi:hypothetical protein
MTIIRDSVVSNDNIADYSKLLDSEDEYESSIPLAVPLRDGEIRPPHSAPTLSSTVALTKNNQLVTPPPKPPRGRSPVNAISTNTSTVTAPLTPPSLPPRPHPIVLPNSAPSSPGQLSALPTGSTALGGLALEDVRLIIRLMQAEGNIQQARALAQTLPVDPEDPNRPIDPEVDIFLGYRPVPRDLVGFDMYDFYEELGTGFYFYSTREIAWEIGRNTDWTNFEVVRAYIKPPYCRGYEQREKIRVYPGQPQDQGSSSAVKRSNSFSFSRIIGALRDEPKYHISSILQNSFNQEVLIADAPVGHGMQIKLGPGLGAQIVRLNDEYNLNESDGPDGGWPVAVYEHTRIHGRLRALVQRMASDSDKATSSSDV